MHLVHKKNIHIQIYTLAFVAMCMLFVSIVWGILSLPSLFAQEVDVEKLEELQSKIQESNKEMEELQKEIKRYEAQLKEVGTARATLQGALRELDITRQKMATDIRVTENRIRAMGYEIDTLEEEILAHEGRINRDKEAVSISLRRMYQLQDDSILLILLKHGNLSEFWQELDMMQQFETGMRSNIQELFLLKQNLEEILSEQEERKNNLDSLRGQLSSERQVLDGARREQGTLLEKTQSEEAQYQALLKEKREARQALESQLRDYESQIKFILDPSSIPRSGSGALSWPFSPDYMANCPTFNRALGNQYCITQLFGNTTFAQSGAYRGRGHNGIDFRAPVGTAVRSTLSGSVTAVGNTDAFRGCYSYGKWILVKHPNGLTTLYAHLSHIDVRQGESVRVGQIVGYSGNTGYSTGPHLHLSVFASEGVQVIRMSDVPGRNRSTPCDPATIPVAPHSAYLNPLDFLL